MRILPSALEKEIPVSNEIPIAGAPFGDLEREVGHSLDIEIWTLGFPLWPCECDGRTTVFEAVRQGSTPRWGNESRAERQELRGRQFSWLSTLDSRLKTPRRCDGRHSGLLIRRTGFDSQAGYWDFGFLIFDNHKSKIILSLECGGLHATLRRSRIRFDS